MNVPVSRGHFISNNVLIYWFKKVKSPVRLSTYFFS